MSTNLKQTYEVSALTSEGRRVYFGQTVLHPNTVEYMETIVSNAYSGDGYGYIMVNDTIVDVSKFAAITIKPMGVL